MTSIPSPISPTALVHGGYILRGPPKVIDFGKLLLMSSQPENLNNFTRYISDSSLTRAAQQRLLTLQAQRKSQIDAANRSLENFLAVDPSVKPRSKSVPTNTKQIRFSSPKPYVNLLFNR